MRWTPTCPVDVSSEKSESAAENMAIKIEQRVNQLDAALSRTQQAGDLYKLNHANGQPTEVSDDTYTALEKALEYAEMTNGAFGPDDGAADRPLGHRHGQRACARAERD